MNLSLSVYASHGVAISVALYNGVRSAVATLNGEIYAHSLRVLIGYHLFHDAK